MKSHGGSILAGRSKLEGNCVPMNLALFKRNLISIYERSFFAKRCEYQISYKPLAVLFTPKVYWKSNLHFSFTNLLIFVVTFVSLLPESRQKEHLLLLFGKKCVA